MNNNLRLQETMFMDSLRRLARPVSVAVMLGMFALTIHSPGAQAALIGTEAIVNAQQAQQDRARVHDLLTRADVREQLLAAGVDPREVAGRVDALSDAEVQQLAAKMDELPAGGADAIGVLLVVFVVLLITDILGFTDVFPFVKKPVRR